MPPGQSSASSKNTHHAPPAPWQRRRGRCCCGTAGAKSIGIAPGALTISRRPPYYAFTISASTMKTRTVRYTAAYAPTPLSFWVHRHRDARVWSASHEFDPPLPTPVPGRGYPRLEIEFQRVFLYFASLEELDHAIAVLSANPLPSTRRLSRLRGTAAGPNRHWLSRLPGRAKSHKFRRRLVAYLCSARDAFGAVFGDAQPMPAAPAPCSAEGRRER